jgi:zinc transporter, ZIP family
MQRATRLAEFDTKTQIRTLEGYSRARTGASSRPPGRNRGARFDGHDYPGEGADGQRVPESAPLSHARRRYGLQKGWERAKVGGVDLAPALQVFLFALLTALATGIGALPFVFVKDLTRRWLGASNAVAAGLMLAASFGLLYEGVDYGLLRTLAGALTGLVFIVLVRKLLQRDEHPVVFAEMSNLDARKALLIVGVMTMHSFTEGVGVGVSFGGGLGLGLFITLAIAVHNIPEGLAISLVLVPRGVGWIRAALWSVFSSLPQPLMAVPAFLFVEAFKPLLPYGLGFASGAMIWMVYSELVPDALEEASSNLVAIIVTLSVLAMVAFQVLIR